MLKKCEICLKEFFPKPSNVRVGWGRFCSSTCHYLSARKGKMVYCDQCKKEIYRNQTKLAVSRSGKFFCTKSCQTKWRNKYFSGKKHANWISGESTYRDVLLNNNIKQICRRCKNKDHRVLVVHHMDHDRKNYEVRNLLWLCHNCHFFIHYDKLEEQKLLKSIVNKI